MLCLSLFISCIVLYDETLGTNSEFYLFNSASFCKLKKLFFVFVDDLLVNLHCYFLFLCFYLFVAVHPVLNLRRTDLTAVMDLSEHGNARESDIIDTPQTNLAASDEKSEFDEFIASSTSYEDSGHAFTDENEPGILTRADLLVIRTSRLVAPSVGDKQFSETSSDVFHILLISLDLNLLCYSFLLILIRFLYCNAVREQQLM